MNLKNTSQALFLTLAAATGQGCLTTQTENTSYPESLDQLDGVIATLRASPTSNEVDPFSRLEIDLASYNPDRSDNRDSATSSFRITQDLASQLANNDSLEDVTNQETSSNPFTLTLATGFMEEYYASPGVFVGRGPVNQSVIALTYAINDWLTATISDWNNFDFGVKRNGKKGQTTENDPSIDLDAVIPGEAFGIPGSISTKLSFRRWEYLHPHQEGENVGVFGVTYSIPVDFLDNTFEVSAGLENYSIFKALEHSKYANMLVGNIGVALPFILTEDSDGNPKQSLTPSIGMQTAFLDRYTGMSGFSHLTPQVTLTYKNGNVEISAFYQLQMAQDKTREDNKDNFGFMISTSFGGN